MQHFGSFVKVGFEGLSGEQFVFIVLEFQQYYIENCMVYSQFVVVVSTYVTHEVLAGAVSTISYYIY